MSSVGASAMGFGGDSGDGRASVKHSMRICAIPGMGGEGAERATVTGVRGTL